MYKNPFLGVYSLALDYNVKTSNPNKIIPLVEARCTEAKNKVYSNSYADFADDNITADDLDYYRTENPELSDHLWDRFYLSNRQEELDFLLSLPFKSYPIIYIVIVPISCTVRCIWWKYKSLFPYHKI